MKPFTECYKINFKQGEEWAVIPYSDLLKLMDRHGYYLKGNAQNDIPPAVEFKIRNGVNPVRAYREYFGLSQEKLAEKAGVSRATIARIEKGEPCLPVTQSKLAKVLRVPKEKVAIIGGA